MSFDPALLIAPLAGLAGAFGGALVSGRNNRKTVEAAAASARAERAEREESQLHEDVARWSLLEYDWAVSLAAGQRARSPYDQHPGEAQRIAARVLLGESRAVHDAYDRFHRAVLDVRSEVDYDSLPPERELVSELELHADTAVGAAGLRLVARYDELVNTLRAERGLLPLKPEDSKKDE